MRTVSSTEEPPENLGPVLCTPPCTRITISNHLTADGEEEVEGVGPTISVWRESFERNDEDRVSLDRMLERRRVYIVASGTRAAHDCAVMVLSSCCFVTYLVVFLFIAKLIL